ncbi:hypothetical protein GQ600_10643 [Phytophthora cactorum]|nr:hypothetical protein GQ600_10643 [Phytophthora cactorum]
MNLFKHYSSIVILVLLFRVIRPGAATGSRVKIHEVNESPSCSGSTAMYSTIIPAPCTENAECIQESGSVGSNSVQLLRLRPANVPQGRVLEHYVLEHYDDMNCDKLASPDVFRADGKCHNTSTMRFSHKRHCQRQGPKQNVRAWRLGDCGGSIPKANVNTGVCFSMKIHTAKLYLIDGTDDTFASSSSASGSANGTSLTASTLSLAPAQHTKSLTLAFAASVVTAYAVA